MKSFEPTCITNIVNVRILTVIICASNFPTQIRFIINITDYYTALRHTWHVLLSLTWLLRCLSKVPLDVKHLSHTSHIYGRIPVWIRKCRFRFSFVANRFRHILHTKAFSRVCIRKWRSKAALDDNLNWHIQHINDCSFTLSVGKRFMMISL